MIWLNIPLRDEYWGYNISLSESIILI
jgi:hypothetical protein